MSVETDPVQQRPDDASAPTRDAAPRPRRRLAPWIAGAAVLLAAVVLAVVLLGGGDDDDGGTPAARRAPAVAATPRALAALPADVGHAVYWVGARPGTTYELTRTRSGRVWVRYLPSGVPVGTDEATYLTVGSYPQRDALTTLTANARAQGVAAVALPDGGRAFQDADRPTSAYAAFPGSDVQVEVFDATPGQALRLIRAGLLAEVGAQTGTIAGTVEPSVVTEAQLRAFAAGEEGPVYWAGPRTGMRYELTRTADGRIYVRYLPVGVEAGSSDPNNLTVGTYPQQDALQTLRQTAARRGGRTFAVAGGGTGAQLPSNPDSVYVAYPGGAVQVELFDPQGAAKTLARSGAIVQVR
jgi:hypothetical protein